MKKILFIFIIFGLNSIFGQVDENIYELDSIKNLLTKEVEEIVDKNLTEKKVVFLGESQHNIGSDFLAKTEFVKDNGVKNKWWYAYTTLMNISTPEVLADLAEKRAPTAFVVENKVAAVVDLCQKCHQALL